MASITTETFWRLESASEPSLAQFFHGGLHREAFLSQLRFLKYQSDRARTPLSLAIFHFKGASRADTSDLRAFSNEVSKHLHSTDIVGCLDAETLAILLPDRDESSLRSIKYAAISHQGSLSVAIATGTYPDQLFTRLLADHQAEPGLRQPAEQYVASLAPNSVFLERLEVEQVRAERYARPLSLVVLEFDEQNAISPRIEHTRQQILSRLRNTDTVAQLSPTHLAIMLVDTDEIGAKLMIDKLTSHPLGAAPSSILAASYPEQLLTQLLSAGATHGSQRPTAKATTTTEQRFSRHSFLKTLHQEKRRSDRNQATLSLALFKLRPADGNLSDKTHQFLNYLTEKVRATDSIGLLHAGTVGVLLPHTEERSAKLLTDSIKEDNPALNLSVVSGTYPDDMFAKLFSTENQTSDLSPVFLDETVQHSKMELALKRGIDILGALTGLILFAPLMLTTAMAVKLSSPGPTVFKQDRTGHRGQRFKYLKFRSQATNNGDRIHRGSVKSPIEGKADEINHGEEGKPLHKIKADTRLTSVGRIIRKTSLDELPQFWNVLMGEMSLVGPRPPIPNDVEQYQAWQLRRVLEMKPGLTGLWQVEGRSRTTFDEMVRLDLHYVQKWSLWMDMKILFKTVGEVMRSSGATEPKPNTSHCQGVAPTVSGFDVLED